MNIYKFRVILDTDEDVFRDIEIGTESTFEELHEAIMHAFDFSGDEMASFYMSDEEWEKGQEITLLEMGMDAGLPFDGEDPDVVLVMKQVSLKDMIKLPSEKILYVFDFMRMWCFYIELMAHKKAAPSTLYPRVAHVYGDAPAQDSKEADLFDDLDLDGGDKKKEKYLTGDPEIDDYLNDDDDDDYEDSGFENLDDLDDSYY